MIWCVEDDESIRDIELYALKNAGFETRGFEDGKDFWNTLKSEKPELVLLDIMLPEMDGIEILTRMKESLEFRHIPVIMATAKSQEYDRIKGLDLGADDYLVKPFSMMEMVSRVKAVLRRSQPKQVTKLLKTGGLIVNLDEHTVTEDGNKVPLTYKEFELLSLFLSHPGLVYTREQLFAQVWKQDYMEDSRTLDAHIRTLRQKLGVYGKMIVTSLLTGYVKCGNCRRNLTGSYRIHGHLLYSCAYSQGEEDTGCFSGKADDKMLEHIVLAEIKTYLQQNIRREQMQQSMRKQHEECINAYRTESADCQKRQEQIKNQNRQNYEKYHEGQMEREQFLEEKSRLEEERERLQRRVQELEELIKGEEEILLKKNIPVEQMMKFLGYEKLDREMLEKYVEGIYVHDDGRVEVEWKFSIYIAN